MQATSTSGLHLPPKSSPLTNLQQFQKGSAVAMRCIHYLQEDVSGTLRISESIRHLVDSWIKSFLHLETEAGKVTDFTVPLRGTKEEAILLHIILWYISAKELDLS